MDFERETDQHSSELQSQNKSTDSVYHQVPKQKQNKQTKPL